MKNPPELMAWAKLIDAAWTTTAPDILKISVV
jgi:hypothetical protein